jgi:UDP-N-acetyl-D-mannosaminuronic acid dehydrogenase
MDLDGVVLVTDHDAFDEFDWAAFESPLVVLDSRDSLDPSTAPAIGTHHVATLGRPSSD